MATAVATHSLRPAPDALLRRLYAQGVTELRASLLRTMQLFLAVTALLGWTPPVILLLKKEL